MAKLENPKHELFAQGLAKGEGINEAYQNAGYKDSPASATRLSSQVKIVARVTELQERMAQRVEISGADLIEMLLEDRKGARQEGQYSASVSALDKVAKIIGAYAPEKREHTGKDGGPIETADMSEDALAARVQEAFEDMEPDERAALRPLLSKLKG